MQPQCDHSITVRPSYTQIPSLNPRSFPSHCYTPFVKTTASGGDKHSNGVPLLPRTANLRQAEICRISAPPAKSSESASVLGQNRFCAARAAVRVHITKCTTCRGDLKFTTTLVKETWAQPQLVQYGSTLFNSPTTKLTSTTLDTVAGMHGREP